MNRFFLVGPLFLFLFVLGGGECKDVYVNCSYTGDTPDGSSSNPYIDMRTALEGSSAGDRFLVAPGKYTGGHNRDLELNYPLEIRAQDFTDRPDFDLDYKGTFGTFDPDQTKPGSASSSVIIGLILRNGQGDGDTGAALTIKSGSITVAGCDLKENNGDNGGAVIVTTGETSPSVPNIVAFAECSFEKNLGTKGAAVTIYSRQSRQVVVGGCSFKENNASNTGGAIYSEDSALLVLYSNFTSNVAVDGYGGAIATETSQPSTQVKVYSSQFKVNTAAEQGGAIHSNGGTLMLTNSIIKENNLHAAASPGSLRQGAGVYVYGSAMIEGCTITENDADDDGVAAAHGGGLMLSGDDSSWVSNSTFNSNLCFLGSDVAVLSGTTAYFTGVTFEKTVDEGMNQIYSTGEVLFENCDFQQEGGKQSLLSVYAAGTGEMSFEWFPEEVDFSIDSVTLLHDGALKTSSSLNISVCNMHGGLILSTATANRKSLYIMVSMLVSPTTGDKILGISGFDVVNYGLFSLSSGYTFSTDNGRGTFTNEGELVLQKSSILIGMDEFVNNGLMDVNTRAAINSRFTNNNSGTVSLINVVSSSSAALVIGGAAILDGTLKIGVNSTSSEFDKGNTKIPLLSYTSLEGKFSSYEVTSPDVKKSSLDYDSLVLYLTNRGSSDDGLGGGLIALTVIGALIGAVILGGAVWYYWVRDSAGGSDSLLGGGSANDVEI